MRELDDAGNVNRGKRIINQTEAAIVRRIFTEYSCGKSARNIAAGLNSEGVLSPRGGPWNASTINGHRGRHNGILKNEIYVGQLVYNRVRMLRDPETGKRIWRINPESEWVRVPVPELRIISDALWRKVQKVMRRYSGPRSQDFRRPKRLFSGLLTCGECGGAFTLVRPGKYGCATHREKGTCPNGRQISVEKLEHRILAGVKRHLNNPLLLAEFIKEFHSELRRLQRTSSTLQSSCSNELGEIKRKIARIVGAISEGTDTPSLREALISLEDEKARLETLAKSARVKTQSAH